MKKMQSITKRLDGGYDVTFDSDGVRLVCQVYDNSAVSHFTWAEVQAALPTLLDVKLVDPVDTISKAELDAARKEEILATLKLLDAEMPRVVEDLIDAIAEDFDDRGKTLIIDPSKQAIKDEKVTLRNELKTL